MLGSRFSAAGKGGVSMSGSIKNPRIVCVGKKDFTDRVSRCALFIEYVGYPVGLPCLGESIFPLRADSRRSREWVLWIIAYFGRVLN